MATVPTSRGKGRIHPDGSISMDRDRALRVLEEEVRNAREGIPSKRWQELTMKLADAVGNHNRTFIALLGTALLAKATHREIDPYALKKGLGTPGAYSARGLCQHVLAAHAPRLGIDLGVTGREPLNNQPFFAEARVHDHLPVRDSARDALNLLLELLQAIKEMTTEEEAREALRGFLLARQRVAPRSRFRHSLTTLSLHEFVSAVADWVNEDSEEGRRAQSVVAGVLDVLVGRQRVQLARVNDPDRHFPGDVGITRDGDQQSLFAAYEVRDKAVREEDLYHVVTKAQESGLARIATVAVSTDQRPLDVLPVCRWAWEQGVLLGVFLGWSSFLPSTLFLSELPPEVTIRAAISRIRRRASELEVRAAGLESWEKRVGRFPAGQV